MLKVEGIAFRFLPDPVQIRNALEVSILLYSSRIQHITLSHTIIVHHFSPVAMTVYMVAAMWELVLWHQFKLNYT